MYEGASYWQFALLLESEGLQNEASIHRKSEPRNEEKNRFPIIFSEFLDLAVPIANYLWTSHYVSQ